METYKWYWLGGIGLFVFIGFLVFLGNISNHNYYQEQYYNHLPSVLDQIESSKPEAIQHYEEQRDESIVKTEENNLAEKGINTTNTTSLTDNLNSNEPIDKYINLIAWLTLTLSMFLMLNMKYMLPKVFTFIRIYDRTTNMILHSILLSFVLTSLGIVCPIYYLISSFFI